MNKFFSEVQVEFVDVISKLRIPSYIDRLKIFSTGMV